MQISNKIAIAYKFKHNTLCSFHFPSSNNFECLNCNFALSDFDFAEICNFHGIKIWNSIPLLKIHHKNKTNKNGLSSFFSVSLSFQFFSSPLLYFLCCFSSFSLRELVCATSWLFHCAFVISLLICVLKWWFEYWPKMCYF